MPANLLLEVLAGVLLLAPPALAYAADMKIRAFQHEAFGHLARAAFYIRLIGLVILVYYLAIVAGAYAVGELDALVVWPLSGAALLTYVRIGAPIAGYLLLNLVATQLYRVVRPAHAVDGRPVRRPAGRDRGA